MEMATNDDGGAATTTPLRDGVANSSSESSLPDWKRELIERRKNLAKTTAGGLTSGNTSSSSMDKRQAAAGNKSGEAAEENPSQIHQLALKVQQEEDMARAPPVPATRRHSHSQQHTGGSPLKHSKLPAAATTSTILANTPPVNLSSAPTTTTAAGRSPHTATRSPATGTTAALHHQMASKFDFSPGKSVEPNRVSTSPFGVASKSNKPEGFLSGPVASRCAEQGLSLLPSQLKQVVGGGASSPKILLESNRAAAAVKNHHNNNCVDNNNQKRNNTTTDGVAAVSASSAGPASADGNGGGRTSGENSFRSASIQCGGGGVVVAKRADLKQSPAPSGGGGNPQRKDHSFVSGSAVPVTSSISGGCGGAKSANSNHKMVAQEVCESAAMDAAALAIGNGQGSCGSPLSVGGSSDYIITGDETAEELKYGPGIVQRLRSRFMSYTMRLNAAKGQRPSLQNMRRATSLNNLLDDDEDSTRTASPVSQTAASSVTSAGQLNGHKRDEHNLIHHRHSMGNGVGGGRVGGMDSEVQCDGIKKYQNEMLRSRQLRRGNESLKRARSVETLRYDSKAWERDVQMTTTTPTAKTNHHVVEAILSETVAAPVASVQQPREVTIEDKILNARERGDPRPTRLKPFMDDTERPPPDLVKTTLMKFEATANRRGRAPTTRNGEVAAKVANFKSILMEKPAILYPKPPLSPKKPIIKPRNSLHTAALSPIVGHSNGKQQQQLVAGGQRSPSPSLLIQVDMTYKQSTPAHPERRNGTNLLASPPQTPPDLINNIGARGKTTAGVESGHHHLQQLLLQSGGVGGAGGYESPITQLTNKLKSMHLQSPKGVEGGGVGGGLVVVGKAAPPRSDNTASSTSSASTAPSSATSSPVPPHHHHHHQSASGSYYLNGGLGGAGRLELGDVSTEDCYEYRDYEEEEDDDEDDDEQRNDVEQRRSEAINLGLNRGGGGGGDTIESSVDDEDHDDDGGIDEDDDEDQRADDGDEVDNDLAVRRINKVDLQNIGQAGTTQEFRFGQGSANGATAPKSHLPVLKQQPTGLTQPQQKMRFIPSGGVGGGELKHSLLGKNGQNGGFVQELVLAGENGGLNETDVDDCKTTTALLIKQIKEEARKGGSGRDSQLVVNSASVNHINSNSNGNGAVVVDQAHPNHLNNSSSNSARNGNHNNSSSNSDNKQTLTNREIEKNLINRGKSEPKESPSSSALLQRSPGDAKQQAVAPPQQQSSVAATVARKKPWQEEPQTNTMVFNFSKRKDVPDYIDSDGMILLPHRKRELPKPGESGFVVLGDISLETSTDPDDAWTMGPPSPCNIVFENDNVIIDGRSNLRKSMNRSKWSIRFDDSLTSTFEYVSENSFLEAYDLDDMDSSSNDGSQLSSRSSSNGGFFSDSQMSHTGQKFMTISSAPLGSYTPMKGSLASNFELGVTKSPSPGGGSSSVSMSPSPTLSKEEAQRAADGLLNGGGSGSNGAGEPESLQYLTPATDEQTVAWSEGTRATDLLF